MASVTPPSDEAAELLQKLSLNSQTLTPTFQVSNPSRKYAPVKSSVPTGLNKPFERSINPVQQEFMDSSMFYDPNRYPSSTYYYGGYGGSSNEWGKYTQYLNADVVQVPPGLQQPRMTSGSSHPGFMNQTYPNNMIYGQYANTARTGFGFNGYDPRLHGRGGWSMDRKYNARGRGNFSFDHGKEPSDGLNELNRGPRAKGSSDQKDSASITSAVKGQTFPLNASINEDSLPLFPDREQYNKEDFPEAYSDAKFFVIKSYSEDDIHKSIKYGVWASTPNGNKKLDAAYKEAQEKSGGCPIFLLFSVNASGQFVGLAEMVRCVDFNKSVEYWQQDKWNGYFPVKWHIVKDVPNSLLRHITLENNENKPVTNSRDTQEVKFDQGMEVLKIFKAHSSKTCILDDFEFYECRQKTMQDRKARQRQLKVRNGNTPEGFADNKEDKDNLSGKQWQSISVSDMSENLSVSEVTI